MNIFQIIVHIAVGGFVGTSLMTIFSYIVSRKKEEQFREPEVLNELVSRGGIPLNPKKENPVGWILHFGMGMVFATCYYLIWTLTAVDISLLSGTIIGAVNGIVGISGWIILFSVHSNPPSIELNDYYWHLMVAHIVFGFGVAAGFLLV